MDRRSHVVYLCLPQFLAQMLWLKCAVCLVHIAAVAAVDCSCPRALRGGCVLEYALRMRSSWLVPPPASLFRRLGADSLPKL